MNKIFLIDGHAQIFRMYYAFMRRPMVNSKGEDTSILFGFTKMLLELIGKENPSHLAVAFDPPAATFRHEAFPQYKANRSAAPELVKAALEPLQEILKAFGIPVVMMPGFEADDVIGSMAKQWEGEDTYIYMVTPDKDYGQLISPYVYQYKPGKGGNETELIGVKELCENYGITAPEQVIDILTIWGDSSDNIPGIRGIGEVGAKKLIGKYGSLDNIIAHAGELPQKQQEAIQESLEQIQMSRYLVTIKTDIALPVTAEEVKLTPPRPEELNEMFNRFEFNSLRKLLPTGFLAPADAEAQPMQSARPLPEAKESPLAVLAEEAGRQQLLSIQMSSGMCILGSGKCFTLLPDTNLISAKPLFENPSIAKTGYNLKQVIKTLQREEISFNGSLFDLELMHYVLNPERSHREEMLLKSYLGVELHATGATGNTQAAEPEDLFSMFAPQEPALSEVEKHRLGVTAILLPQLKEALARELEEADQMKLYRDMEAPLIPILAGMEAEGVKIDTAHLKAYSLELTGELNAIEQEVRELAGDSTLNISSPKQIGALLYEKLRLNPKVKKSAKGSYPTDEETLNELLEAHPVVDKILEYRGLKKLLSTYIDNFPALISPQTGKIHTTFNQALTATGRLSSANPNLQNIPIRTQRGREIRKAFIPSHPNGFIVSADYSQIELRLMAHLSEDPGLIEAFNEAKDIHTATAAKVFKVTEEEVTKEQRSRAKVANFGIIYGISAFGLSQRLGMTRTDSKELIEQYFQNYPGVKAYMNNMIERARGEGYVETIYGRKRFLPDINSRNSAVRSFNERNAINAPLQGSAADIIKMAMIRVSERLRAENIRSKMILQVHDELVFDVYPNEVEKVSTLVTEEMERVIRLHIPLIAECGSGNNWLEAH